jgi:hypothetical protein
MWGEVYEPLVCNTPGVTRTKTLTWQHMHGHFIACDTLRMHLLGKIPKECVM